MGKLLQGLYVLYKVLGLHFILRCPCYSAIIHLSTEY